MANGKPTLRDVAAEAGVSPMTASNALHGKAGVKESTRAKVLAAAKKLDYRINLTASMLKSGRSNIIHIIVNEFDSPFYSKLTQTLSREITSRGLTPFIEQTQYSPDAAEHALTSNPFSGQLFDGEILHATGLGTNLPARQTQRRAPSRTARRMRGNANRGCREFSQRGGRTRCDAVSDRPGMPEYCDCRAYVRAARRVGACAERICIATSRSVRGVAGRRIAI